MVPRQDRTIKPDGRWAMLLDGRITADDLDDEELARGYPKAADGTFRGKPPVNVPPHLYQAMRARFQERMMEKFRKGLPGAIEALVDISGDTNQSSADRIRAANLVVERILGKVPDKMEVKPSEGAVWQMDIAGILRDHPGTTEE